jgi:hypothetical protein
MIIFYDLMVTYDGILVRGHRQVIRGIYSGTTGVSAKRVPYACMLRLIEVEIVRDLVCFVYCTIFLHKSELYIARKSVASCNNGVEYRCRILHVIMKLLRAPTGIQNTPKQTIALI